VNKCDILRWGRTEGGDKYKAKEDSKAKELVVAQPMGELIKALIEST
jgi:hypothetical protein